MMITRSFLFLNGPELVQQFQLIQSEISPNLLFPFISKKAFNKSKMGSRSRSSFMLFTQNEVEQAKGTSTVTNEINPVQYESRRYNKDGEELSDEDDESMLDDDPILRNPHQYPARYMYEVAEDEGLYHSTEEPVVRKSRLTTIKLLNMMIPYWN